MQCIEHRRLQHWWDHDPILEEGHTINLGEVIPILEAASYLEETLL